MTEFEQALTRAMRRVETRAELSAKLLVLAAEAEAKRPAKGILPRWTRLSNGGKVLIFPRQRGSMSSMSWMGGAIAAALVLAAVLGDTAYVHREHQRKAQAQREFETATRITDQALAHTRRQLQRAGISLNELE
jgi:hypothetical protein